MTYDSGAITIWALASDEEEEEEEGGKTRQTVKVNAIS